MSGSDAANVLKALQQGSQDQGAGAAMTPEQIARFATPPAAPLPPIGVLPPGMQASPIAAFPGSMAPPPGGALPDWMMQPPLGSTAGMAAPLGVSAGALGGMTRGAAPLPLLNAGGPAMSPAAIAAQWPLQPSMGGALPYGAPSYTGPAPPPGVGPPPGMTGTPMPMRPTAALPKKGKS